MVGPPRGPARPPMAPQPPAQPHHQLILKQVTTPFTMLAKPPAPNYVNYLSLPVMPGNGSYLAVTSKPGETNGTTILTVAPRPTYTENNNSATYIAMDNIPHSHQYLIPKPEPFAMHNYSKNEPATPPPAGSAASHPAFAPPAKRRSPAATRPTNHQRIKEEVEEEEGEEVRPRLDPSLPFQEQLVRIDHSYPHWLPTPSPREDDKESTISSDEKVDHNEEGEETETAAEGEDSVTRCICNLEHDDGYMISCDQCYVWQHVACVLPDTPLANSLPDMAYLCDLCQPRPLDRHRARALQIQRRKQILHRDDSSDDSWSSVDRSAPPPKKAVARRRAEPIPRRPSKRDSTDGSIRSKSDVRSKKLDSLLDSSVRSKLLKAGGKSRRDSAKAVPPPPPPPPLPPATPAPSVGRRTKLKRKFESKTNQRRKSKSKEGADSRGDKEEERRRGGELRPRSVGERQAGNKSRCRLTHSAIGEPMVVATCRVACGEPLAELRGKYLQSSGAGPKAELLFHYRFPKDGTEVLMDGSGRENVVRHARRCCTPNAHIKHCLVKGSLRLYLVSLETLDRNQQITIPHGCVTEAGSAGVRESCGKDCVYNPTSPLIPQSNPISAPPPHHKLSPRRRSRRTTVSEESDREADRDGLRPQSPLSPTHSERDRKLTREEKKIEQAMKIFAQMERDTARKRDKPPGAVMTSGYRRGGDSDKESPVECGKPRRRRRRRKRRNSRKSRLPSGSGTGLSQVHSGDESDVSSGDELHSPHDKHDSKDSGREDDNDDDKIVGMDDAAGLLLALGGARHHSLHPAMTPPLPPPDHHHIHSENDSSPSTPLSSACLLVAAAVGPLAPGFKFPKTKKGLMNEWLGRSPEHTPSDLSPSAELGPPVPPCDLNLPPGAPKLSNLSNRLYCPTRENCAGFAGFGKKRWLIQAISEEIEAPLESPPCPPDNVTPLKKRRLARESLTSEAPLTPPGQTAAHADEDAGYGGGDSPKSPGSNGSELVERFRVMQRDYLAAQGIEPAEVVVERPPPPSPPPPPPPPASVPAVEEEAQPAQVYDTSPQRVAENLTLPRPASPVAAQMCTTPPNRIVGELPTSVIVSTGAASVITSSIPVPLSDGPLLVETAVTPSSPVMTDTLPARRVRKRPAPRSADPRSSPRVKRLTRKSEVEALAESRLQPEAATTETDCSRLPIPVCVVDEPCVNMVKSEGVADPRLAVMPHLEPETFSTEDMKSGEMLMDLMKTEASLPPLVKEECHAPSNMDLLAMEAMIELSKPPSPPSLSDVKPELMPQLKHSEEVKSEAAAEMKELTPPEPKTEDKAAPIRRKLSITEYLKRKKGSGPKTDLKSEINEAKSGNLEEKARPASPLSDDDTSPLMKPTPTLPFMDDVKGGQFMHLNLNERLRREFGLAITDDESPRVGAEATLPTLPPLPLLSPPLRLPSPPRLSPPLRLPSPPRLSPPPQLSPPSRLSPPRSQSPPPVLTSPPTLEMNGFPESKLDYIEVQNLPQSAIYPVGSSNPPNPFTAPYPAPERRKFRK